MEGEDVSGIIDCQESDSPTKKLFFMIFCFNLELSVCHVLCYQINNSRKQNKNLWLTTSKGPSADSVRTISSKIPRMCDIVYDFWEMVGVYPFFGQEERRNGVKWYKSESFDLFLYL
jgi:hypothetical protein